MAKFKLTFYGTETSGTGSTELQCFLDESGEIYISINDGNIENWIYLDKSTSIKIAKTIRTEINKMETEVGNV